ncbi:hexamerin-1.1-like [Anopheles ziemanni]|uniref:hexamerin-1.1-like n=1 Tax=Anopheles coustani TaxID=139045 RepID=UPI002657DA2A|nr:hexamerin-1.1-like [Anopheles coustani]XP_058170032.1 hexamerin-1.1-like [Anopheles ziemanni]
MKLIILTVAISLAVLASGSYVPSTKTEAKYADKDFLFKQKFFFEVLRNIHLPLKYEEYMPYTKSWVADETKYTDFAQVVEFFDFYKTGAFLEKGEIFTIYNAQYVRQTYALFSFLYNSADWDTYYKNLIWARDNVNEGMFIYVVHLTVMHRPDLQGIVLPAIYEIYPYFFYNTDVIRSITYKKLYDPKFGFYGNGKYNVVYANYTQSYPVDYYNSFYSEEIISYFTEDVGLNSYYYYFMMDYPFILGEDKFGLMKDRRGELYWYMHQTLLARYNLERMANYMGTVKPLVWRFPLKTGYFSLLSYWNGVPFKSRDFNYMISDESYMKVDWINSWESKIRQIIEAGYYIMEDGSRINLRLPESVEFFGNLLNSNVDAIDANYVGYVEVFSRLLLSGNDFNAYKVWPSALMQFETSLRDPVFYQLYERFMDLYYYFKRFLPSYTYDELNFNGVIIKDVAVDKLVTYFDFFDADVSNVLPMQTPEKYFDGSVLARQQRLNHKPFSYTMNVMSEYTGKAIVRMFLGPKFDRFFDLQFYKKYFVEIDQYLVDFTAGQNSFVRQSRDFYWSVKDRTMYTELYKKTMLGFNGQEKFVLDMSEAHCGFPDRLILPKGWSNGMPMQFYFIITPYTAKPTYEQADFYDKSFSCGVGSGMRYYDTLPMGYPFDRVINFNYFYTKNMYFKDVLIYHSDEMKMNHTF